MGPSNHSFLNSQERSFECCCDIAWKHFEIIGEPVLEFLNCILTVPTSLTATVGNLLVLLAIWKTPNLHTPSNCLLLNLALTDLGVGLTIPLYFVSIVAKIERNAVMYCKLKPIYNICSHALCGVSVATLCAISIDRFLALRLHLRYKGLVTVRRVTVVIVCMWAAGFVYGITRIWSFTFNAYFAAVMLSISSAVIIIAYCYIYLEIRRHRAHMRAQRPTYDHQQQLRHEYRKFYSNTLAIHFVFLLCYGPYLVVRVYMIFSDATALYSVLDFTGALVHINSTLNPVVYCWRFENIRIAVKDTVRKYARFGRQRNPPVPPLSTNAFTPKSDQLQISPTASRAI